LLPQCNALKFARFLSILRQYDNTKMDKKLQYFYQCCVVANAFKILVYVGASGKQKQGINIMRMIVAAVLAVTLSATSLWAADTAPLASSTAVASDNTAPLAAGKPAGVKKAQGIDNLAWWLVGAGAIAGIIVIATQSGGAQLGSTTGTQ
jgi:hypothetical protein